MACCALHTRIFRECCVRTRIAPRPRRMRVLLVLSARQRKICCTRDAHAEYLGHSYVCVCAPLARGAAAKAAGEFLFCDHRRSAQTMCAGKHKHSHTQNTITCTHSSHCEPCSICDTDSDTCCAHFLLLQIIALPAVLYARRMPVVEWLARVCVCVCIREKKCLKKLDVQQWVQKAV